MSDNNCEVINNKASNNKKNPKEKFNEGINVCVWFLFSCFVVHLGIENYSKYGIVRNPLQLTLDFIEHISNYWWLYFAALLSVCAQILICFFLEKLLIWKTISERVGLVLHIVNSMLTLNCLAVLINIYQCNPVVAHYVITLVFFHPLKFWSYIYTNRNLRLNFQTVAKENESEKNYNDVHLTYPQNVSLKNLAAFVATTHLMTYNINGVKKKPKDFKKALKLIYRSVITHYLIAFLTYQLIFPEAEVASQAILKGDYLNLIGTGFRLAIPVTAVWLFFFYYYCFECYMVLFGCLWGTEDVETLQDWWNAETTGAYWARWNFQAHNVFRECIFVPVLKMGYTKRQATLAVFFITGIWHEYLLTVPCRTGYGVILSGMLTQVPFNDVTTYLFKRFGAPTGNFTFWFILISGEVLSTIILYYKYNYNNSLSVF